MASSLLDVCRFNPAAGGTADWTYSSAVTGYQSPAAAGAVNGAIYSYRAESNDLTQWEVGYGAYNSGTAVLSRTTILFNSAGTTAKISFATVPQIAIVALGEDLLSFNAAMSLTSTQKAQANSNLFIGTTTQLLTSGTTYTTPAGALWIEVFINAGGGGGGGSGTGGQGNGGTGGTTTFNSVTAIGGSGGAAAGGVGVTAGQFGGAGGAGGTGSVTQRRSGQRGANGGSGITSVTNGLPGTGGRGGGDSNGDGGMGASVAGNGVGGAGGGGGGEQAFLIIDNPSASYAYTIGAAGSAGVAGTGGAAGTAGTAGNILVIEHYG